jgi:putative hydroxymethylpyrimidine transport system ATP-binding protein
MISNQPIHIAITGLELRYHNTPLPIIKGLNLSLAAGKWTCLLGQSGCGKTTLLRYLAGTAKKEIQSDGNVQINRQFSTTPADYLASNVAYMAQQDLLFPWLTVLDNVCLAERFGEKPVNKRNKALNLLQQVGLYQERDSLPQTLSGGMRQRVALARTLMQDQPIILMDEPFSALDAVTRHQLQNLTHQLLVGKTVVMITHDPLEALRLGDAIYIFSGNPSYAQAISPPASTTPRQLNQICGDSVQQIMTLLGGDNVKA